MIVTGCARLRGRASLNLYVPLKFLDLVKVVPSGYLFDLYLPFIQGYPPRVQCFVAHSEEDVCLIEKQNKSVEVNGRGGLCRSFHVVREFDFGSEWRCPPVPHLLRSWLVMFLGGVL